MGRAFGLCAVALLLGGNAFAEALDCKPLNEAYDATRNLSRYQVKFYTIAPDQTEKRLFMEQRWRGIDLYDSDKDGVWKKRYREQYFSVSDDGPIFSNCTILPEQLVNGVKVSVFEADWQREQRQAKITVKVAVDTGLMLEASRTMTAVSKDPNTDLVVGQKIIEEYTYDRNVPVPPPFE